MATGDWIAETASTLAEKLDAAQAFDLLEYGLELGCLTYIMVKLWPPTIDCLRLWQKDRAEAELKRRRLDEMIGRRRRKSQRQIEKRRQR